jgi:hypothetical protein
LDDAEHGDLLQIFFRVTGAARDVSGHGLGDIAVLQCQSIGGGMGIDRAVAPRLGREGNHQLNGIDLAVGPGLWSSSNPDTLGTVGPWQTRRHHGRPQR